MTTRISNSVPARKLDNGGLAPKQKAPDLKVLKKSLDEMSTGRGKRLQELIKKPPLGDIKRLMHNQQVARDLKPAIEGVLKTVRFARPLSAEDSPRAGANGQMVAPNGDPLIRVKLSEGGVPGSSQYALVDPKTNQFYVQNNGGGFTHPTTYSGPLSLPKDSRFQGSKFTPADLKRFEGLANAGPIANPGVRRFQELLKAHLEKGDLKFSDRAPKPEDIASETVLKTEHPFTYYAITLESDPKHTIIKKVLTGGIRAPLPGEGSYSQPIAI